MISSKSQANLPLDTPHPTFCRVPQKCRFGEFESLKVLPAWASLRPLEPVPHDWAHFPNDFSLTWVSLSMTYTYFLIRITYKKQAFLLAMMFQRCQVKPLICAKVTDDRRLRCQVAMKLYIYIFIGLSPHPVTVTTRIITCLIGNPYKP